jgi:phosphoribosyl-AMP cyclohydrolase
MSVPRIDFAKGSGLVPVAVQDSASGELLMLAYMNETAFEETVQTGRACYFSRSRKRLWRKGETSGNVQHVREIRIDCDGDAILLKVEQVGGAACHEGYRSCFFRRHTDGTWDAVGERVFDPAAVYGHRGPTDR